MSLPYYQPFSLFLVSVMCVLSVAPQEIFEGRTATVHISEEKTEPASLLKSAMLHLPSHVKDTSETVLTDTRYFLFPYRTEAISQAKNSIFSNTLSADIDQGKQLLTFIDTHALISKAMRSLIPDYILESLLEDSNTHQQLHRFDSAGRLVSHVTYHATPWDLAEALLDTYGVRREEDKKSSLRRIVKNTYKEGTLPLEKAVTIYQRMYTYFKERVYSHHESQGNAALFMSAMLMHFHYRPFYPQSFLYKATQLPKLQQEAFGSALCFINIYMHEKGMIISNFMHKKLMKKRWKSAEWLAQFFKDTKKQYEEAVLTITRLGMIIQLCDAYLKNKPFSPLYKTKKDHQYPLSPALTLYTMQALHQRSLQPLQAPHPSSTTDAPAEKTQDTCTKVDTQHVPSSPLPLNPSLLLAALSASPPSHSHTSSTTFNS